MNIVSIHQPSYFPWLGLLHKVNKSDTFILMDEVQLADRAFQHRNQFLTKDGKVKMLTINIRKKDYRNKFIKNLKISNSNWNIEHKNFIIENYKNLPFFDEIMPFVENVINLKSNFLIDILERSFHSSLKLFDIDTEVIKMSDLNYDKTKHKSELILELVERSGSKTYLSGIGAKDYLNTRDFENKGIDIKYQDFSHPKYYQENKLHFTPGLSCLDILFNEGIQNSKQILKNL